MRVVCHKCRKKMGEKVPLDNKETTEARELSLHAEEK